VKKQKEKHPRHQRL